MTQWTQKVRKISKMYIFFAAYDVFYTGMKKYDFGRDRAEEMDDAHV